MTATRQAEATPWTIARLAASALIVLAAEPLYLMFDIAVVGRLGASALAGLTVGGLVLATCSTQLTFLSYGTTARSARLFGAGDRRGAVVEGAQATWLAVGVGCVLAAALWVLAPFLLRGLAGDPGIVDSATSWLRIAAPGVPLILVTMAGNGWMRGVQSTRLPAVFVIIGFGVSGVLCPALVHGLFGAPRLGLEGSAVANVIGQTITGVLFLGALLREPGGRCGPKWSIIRAQLVLGRDLIVRSLGFQVCFLSAAAVASRFGVAAVAAHQTTLQVWGFLALVLDSLAVAAQSLVGAALGARDAGRARVVGRLVTRWSVVAATLMAVLLGLGASMLPRVFTTDADVLDAVVVPWWFLVGMLPVAGIVFALDGVLLGAGDAAYLRTATLASALLGFLPLIWASLVFSWGLAGIWTGLLAFMLARLVTLLLRMRSGAWARLGT